MKNQDFNAKLEQPIADAGQLRVSGFVEQAPEEIKIVEVGAK